MGAKSEFQRVLEKHLGLESSSSSTHTNNQMPDLQENFLNQIKFTLERWNIKSTTAYPKVNVRLEEKVIVEKIREKRKLTFDQLKAIKTFSKYSMLPINEFSTDDEIKSAYRRLAKLYHPDFNKNGADDFKIISMAYNKLIK